MTEVTLRDFFAMQALQGILANKKIFHSYNDACINADMAANLAYYISDAMLAKRNSKEDS